MRGADGGPLGGKEARMGATGWDKAALEEAGVGWVVVLWHDLADLVDPEAVPTVCAWLTGAGMLDADGETLTYRGRQTRRAALRLLAVRAVSPLRVEALAGGDLARWAALAAVATPGPWCVRAGGDRVQTEAEGEAKRVIVAETVAPDCWREDADFIAAARTAVPALLAEVARMRADLRAATSAIHTLEYEAGTRDEPQAGGSDPSPEELRGYILLEKSGHADGLTTEQRERVGYTAALIQASAFTCVTGRAEDAARTFAALLGRPGETEAGRLGAARALRDMALVLEGRAVPATTARQDVEALRQEAAANEKASHFSEPLYAEGIRRALLVLYPHLPKVYP